MENLKKVRAKFKKVFLLLAAFSLVVNVLMLTMPMYMLQIYDRILPSRSIDTLIFLSIIAVAALIILGSVEAIRGIVAARAGAMLEAELGADTLTVSIMAGRGGEADVQPLRELASIRNFIASRSVFALLDLPFAPLFIGLLYLIHPSLFWLTLGGGVILLLIALFNQWILRDKSADASGKQGAAMVAANSMALNEETIHAMGMIGNGVSNWGTRNSESMISQGSVDVSNAIISGISRSLRLLLQIATLGLGGWLVLNNEMTAGMIFAASIISGRGLQPLDQVIGGWKQMNATWRAWKSLSHRLSKMPKETERTIMPTPVGRLTAESVLVMPESGVSGDPILNRISFTIEPGDIVGVVGPSGSGKSTLARLLVGAQFPNSGVVRVDGTDIQNWDPAQLGQNIGYLSQEVRLFPGTVKQNIARLAPNPDDAAVLEAAQKAHVHSLVQGLPNGYDTVLGPGGFIPSIGQRQRISLARAFYGNPQIMVLDEPNANLDDDGELALKRAIEAARESGATVVIIAQRKQVLTSVDKILRLHSGKLDFFGKTEDFLAALREAVQRRENAPAGQPPANTDHGRQQQKPGQSSGAMRPVHIAPSLTDGATDNGKIK